MTKHVVRAQFTYEGVEKFEKDNELDKIFDKLIDFFDDELKIKYKVADLLIASRPCKPGEYDD